MENLFGSSLETKDETGIKQLKVSIDKSILDLQTYVEEYPTKNEIRSFILHSKTSMKKTNDTLSKIASRMERIANNAKSKKGATKKFNDKIFSMLEPLDRDIKDYVEEEDDLQIALNASLKKRNEKLVWVKMKERKVEEVKMLSEVKEPLLDLDNCSLHELILSYKKLQVILPLMPTKHVLVLILLIMF